MPLLPIDAKERKNLPIGTGVLDYFPNALAEVARASLAGNRQHLEGQPLHWDKLKSTDEADALIRHFLERGTMDEDNVRHSGKMAWRALALLEREILAEEKLKVAISQINYLKQVGTTRCIRCDFVTDDSKTFAEQNAEIHAHLNTAHPGWITETSQTSPQPSSAFPIDKTDVWEEKQDAENLPTSAEPLNPEDKSYPDDPLTTQDYFQMGWLLQEKIIASLLKEIEKYKQCWWELDLLVKLTDLVRRAEADHCDDDTIVMRFNQREINRWRTITSKLGGPAEQENQVTRTA